jgi:hypothetical protein
MSGKLLIRVTLLAAALCCGPSAAQACPVLITRGETVTDMGRVQPQFHGANLPSTQVGYKYGHFGVFWVDLWTWDGTWCLHSGNRYWALKPAQAAELLGKTEAQLHPPFLYRFPPGLLIATGLIVLWVVKLFLSRQPPNPVVAVLQDQRYRDAVDLFYATLARQEEAAPPPTAPQEGALELPPPRSAEDEARARERIAVAHEAAVASLVKQGIPRGEAEFKLDLALAATQQAPGS